eukprot:scaffold107008_cov25-Tisochrysis_lutea.AAC.2
MLSGISQAKELLSESPLCLQEETAKPFRLLLLGMPLPSAHSFEMRSIKLRAAIAALPLHFTPALSPLEDFSRDEMRMEKAGNAGAALPHGWYMLAIACTVAICTGRRFKLSHGPVFCTLQFCAEQAHTQDLAIQPALSGPCCALCECCAGGLEDKHGDCKQAYSLINPDKSNQALDITHLLVYRRSEALKGRKVVSLPARAVLRAVAVSLPHLARTRLSLYQEVSPEIIWHVGASPCKPQFLLSARGHAHAEGLPRACSFGVRSIEKTNGVRASGCNMPVTAGLLAEDPKSYVL